MKTVEDILEHHGVKGQKWGIRNDKGHAGQKATTRKIRSLDKKFARRRGAPRTTLQVYNRAAKNFNDNDLKRINNKPQYKNADFTRDTPLRKKYYNEHKNALLDQLEKAADEFGTNASGTQKYGIVETPNGGWDIYLKDVKHAASSSNKIVLKVQPKFDSRGHIIGLALKNSMAQSAMVDAFLEHHGVKGQKWGIRNKKSRVRPASADSRKVSELKKKHASQLTNKQLKTIQERHNLEQTLKRANPHKIEKGHAFAKGLVAIGSTATALYALSQSPLFKHVVTVGKAFVDINVSGKFTNSRKIDVSKFQRSAQGKLF